MFSNTWYTKANKGIFDDRISRDVQFFGAYLVVNKVRAVKNVDIYYLGQKRTSATYDDGAGTEVRHAIGSRIWGGNTMWEYDFEAVYQTGKLDHRAISAWTASGNINFAFYDSRINLKCGVKTEVISGDKHYDDGRINTFNPLFPRGSYFGLAALIGPSNLIDFHPYIEFDVSEKISFKPDIDFFWRHSSSDGLYSTPVDLIYSGRHSDARYIGKQLAIEGFYTYNAFFNARAEITWFKTGKYLKEVSSGKNIWLLGTTLQLKF